MLNNDNNNHNHIYQWFVGSYALHKDPKSEAILCVSVSVSQYVWGREDTWQISESFYNLAGRLGSSNSKLFRRPLLLSGYCCRCVLNCSRFLCVGKFWRAFHRKLEVFVQGKLCSISKLLCRAVYDLSFISKINCTALPWLFFVISFRCWWVEFPRRYRSCVLAQGNISRLAWCLVRIVLKLRRFCKPTFMVLKSGAWCKYLTSVHEYLMSSHKPVFIGLNYRCRLHLKLKELLYSQK